MPQGITLVIAQALGIIGMAMNIGSLQCRRVRSLYLVQFIAAVFFTVSYLMLGSLAGALLNIYGFLRGLVFVCGNKAHKPPFLLLLFVVLTGIGVYTVFWEEGPLALIPFIAQIIGTIGMWTRNGRTLRILQFCGVSPLWLTYNCIHGTIGGIGCEIFSMVSVLVSIWRFGWRALGEDPKDRKTADKAEVQ